MNAYTAVIEKCLDTGLYVGYIPGFPGAHSQEETVEELNRNLKEVIEMLSPVLLRQIAKDIGLTVQELPKKR